MSRIRNRQLRQQIAEQAARLMYEEDVREYFTAKRMAAKRVLGRKNGRKLRFRPHDLPSNGEIQAALIQLAELSEGQNRTDRLAAMRLVALETLRALEPFQPRLIGSVSTGHVRRGSDIDIHVFADHLEPLQAHLQSLHWVHECQRVTIQKFGQIREYTHIHIADIFAIELTVYPRHELRHTPRSSTDGKPIRRLRAAQVEALIRSQHPTEWSHYQDTGALPEPDRWLEQVSQNQPGRYDSLLSCD